MLPLKCSNMNYEKDEAGFDREEGGPRRGDRAPVNGARRDPCIARVTAGTADRSAAWLAQ